MAEKNTTISVSKKIKETLDDLKEYSRETYNDVLIRMLKVKK
jgi:hypothetical protein